MLMVCIYGVLSSMQVYIYLNWPKISHISILDVSFHLIDIKMQSANSM